MLSRLLLFVLFSYSLIANAQWKKIYNSNTNDLFDVQLIGNIGYICGFSSTMLKTTDTGKTWKPITLPIFLNARCVYFKDSAIGFVTGENARILKTINGGISWTQKFIKTAAYTNDITFNGNFGLAVGNNFMAIRSSDFGETWQNDNTFFSRKKLNNVCIMPSGKCFAVGDSGFILSKHITDNTWKKLPFITKINLNDIQYLNDSTLIICGGMQDTAGASSVYKNVVLYSNDTGNSWQQSSFNEMRIINKAWYSNKDTAYFVGSSGLISKSHELLNNRSLQLTSTANTINSVSFENNTGISVGDGGLILRTSNAGGFRLNAPNIQIQNYSIVYPNPSTGYINFTQNDIQDILITDITGKKVSFEWINNQQINITAKGFFFIEVVMPNGAKQGVKVAIF